MSIFLPKPVGSESSGMKGIRIFSYPFGTIVPVLGQSSIMQREENEAGLQHGFLFPKSFEMMRKEIPL